MKSTILRSCASTESSRFKATLDQVLPLVNTLEEGRTQYSSDLRAEISAELDVLAGAIEGADLDWPELQRPCRQALEGIYSLMTRLSTEAPAAIAGKDVVAFDRAASIHNPFLTEMICRRLQQSHRKPVLVEITEGETAEEQSRIGQIREVLKCDPSSGAIVARLILKPYDCVVCRGHHYELPRAVSR